MSTNFRFIIFFALTVLFYMAPVGTTADGVTVSSLRERVEVLDQARVKAAGELVAMEQQQTVTSRDREHYRTVAIFLDQQIADSCNRLIDQGGAVAVAGLPCPDAATVPEKVEDKPPAESNREQPAQDQQKKEEVQDVKQSSPAKMSPPVLPPESVPTKKEQAEKAAPEQKAQDTGVLATIRSWWESLFAPKPPPGAPGGEGVPRKEQEKAAAVETPVPQPGDSAAQQAAQEEGLEEKEADDGSQGQSDTIAGMEESSGKKGEGGQEEQQLLTNGAGKASGNEQTAGAELATADGTPEISEQGEGKAGKDPGAAGVAGSKEDGSETGEGRDVTGKDGAGPKAENKEKDSRGRQENGQGSSPAGQELNRPVDAGKGIQKKVNGRPEPAGSGQDPSSDTEVSSLEKSLNDALGEFDGKMLNEQERLAARIPSQREGSAGGSGGYGAEGALGPDGEEGLAGGGYEGAEGKEGDGRAGSGNNRQPGSVRAGGGKPAPSGGRSTIGADDDIVARQLREAAEKETDPALKEKLWQEYRKYKRGG